jgi:hypothetical protein
MASSYNSVADGDVSIGRIFSRAFAAISANPGTMFGIPVVFGALPGLVYNIVVQTIGYSAAGRVGGLQMAAFSTTAIVAAIVVMVISTTSQGALVRTTAAYSDEGRLLIFGEAAAAGLRVILPLIVLWILFFLAVFLGWVIFIVPAIMLCAMWAVAQPALVEERVGILEAFGRSRDLTRGSRWLVFALGLIMIVIVLILSSVSFSMGMAAGFGGARVGALSGGLSVLVISTMLIGSVSSVLTTVLLTTLQTSLYIELRNAKEGLPTEALSEVFA